jgi:glycerophosphoryl diester phosphodiesterase
VILTDLSARPVIAHRGDSAHHPENTFPSFDRAVALGVDALEFDLRVTRDGVAVVLHDATVDRTTSGSGAVAAMTLAELRALDAGARFSPDVGVTHPFAWQGLVVPTFAEMLERYREIPLLIEVKVPEAVAETRRLVAEHGARDRVLLDSTDYRAVEPFRTDGHTTGASMKDVLALLRRACLPGAPSRLPYEALCIPRWYNGIRVPVGRLASVARRARTVTHVWTVNDPRVAARLWRMGINGIVTDDPGAMLRSRGELPF